MRYRAIFLILAFASLFFIGSSMTGFVVSEPCCTDCSAPCKAATDMAVAFAGTIVFSISLALYAFMKHTGEKV